MANLPKGSCSPYVLHHPPRPVTTPGGGRTLGNIVVRKSRLCGVLVIANDEDEAFVEAEYVDEVIEALRLLRGNR